MLDLRLPSGIFFALTGAILIIYSVAVPGLSAPMSSARVDLYSGLIMLIFGVALLALAARSRRT